VQRLQLPSRTGLARFGAPAAFLLGVTVAVLLVRAGLAGSEGATSVTSTTTVATTRTTTSTRERTTTTSTQEEPRFYTIERGDTFGTVAAEFGTTVERLIELNPGVDTTELRIGQRIRVA
jgi:LysM repeat protein